MVHIYIYLSTFWTALIANIPSIAAQDVTDLEAIVRDSEQYKEIELLCGQCALAGNDNSGCWGEGFNSAVRQSGCTDQACFCSSDVQPTVVEVIEDLVGQLCESSDVSTAGLTLNKYAQFCETELTVTVNTALPPTGSTTSSQTTESTTPPLPTKSGSNDEESGSGTNIWTIIGPIVGIVGACIAAGSLYLGWKQYRARKDEGQGVRLGEGDTPRRPEGIYIFNANGVNGDVTRS